MNVAQQASRQQPKPPFRPISYAAPRIASETMADGVIHLRSLTALERCDPSLARLFRAAVEAQPERLFLAERSGERGWRSVTYGEARRTVDALAQSLIDRGLSAERPVMILSGNAIDH